jgi:hypothetical protein
VHKDLRRSPVIRAMLDFLTAMFTADADFLRYGSRRTRAGVDLKNA